MTVVRFEPDVHTAVQSLLPWYAGRRLDADDLALVESHLASCERCRAELDLEARLRVLQADAEPLADVDQGWRAMRARIASDEAHAQRRPAAWLAWPSSSWLRWALGAQTAAIAILAALLLWPTARPASGDEAYRALGTPGTTTTANAIVMFKPDATEAQMSAALRASGARLVGGPTDTHGYLLSLPAEGHVAAIAALRGRPEVSLAESLGATR